MIPVLDFSNEFTVDNTAYNSTNKYAYEAPSGRFLVVQEISIAGDSTFLSDGRIQMSVAGNAVTSKAGASSEVNVINGFSSKIGTDDIPCVLSPSEEIEVLVRTTSGTGKAQIMLTGMLLNEVEYKQYMKNKGWL